MRDGPLLSACLIVRDEEQALPSCLASLARLVDEVVVYDTGSTDGTVAVARALGATVIEGHWSDHFGWARNQALAHCRGTWVLSVDADEVAVCDAGTLRAALHRPDLDAWQVEIENLLDNGTGTSYVTTSRVLFRRDRCTWSGRIHEQIRRRDGEPIASSPTAPGLLLLHTGYLGSSRERYLDRHGETRDERNLRLARLALCEAGPAGRRDAGYEVARALLGCGRAQEAAAALREVARSGDPLGRRALLLRAKAWLAATEPAACLDDVGRLRAALPGAAPVTGYLDLLEGQALLALDQPLDALVRFEAAQRAPGLVDLERRRHPRALLPLHRGLALALLGRWAAAADCLLVTVAGEGAVVGNVGVLVDTWACAGRTAESLAAQLPAELLDAVATELAGLPAQRALPLVAALAFRHGETAALLDAAQVLAAHDIDAALLWSPILLGAGRDCPLLARAGDASRHPAERFQAAVLADGPAARRFEQQAADDLDPGAYRWVLLDLDARAPDRLPRAILSLAGGTPARRRAVAGVLTDLGAHQQAGVLEGTARTLEGSRV